jgi:hypothetical protein
MMAIIEADLGKREATIKRKGPFPVEMPNVATFN